MEKQTFENLISVCLPCFNAEKYIKECIDSILTQSFPHFELLIADDGSSDQTVSIIRSYQDPRIHLYQNEHNYIKNLNFLLEKAKGKYIARMDADDKMLPDRLLTQYNYMEFHPDIDLLGGGMTFFGKRQGEFIPPINKHPITKEELLEHNQIAHPTVMIRKSSLLKLPVFYEENYIYAEDYKLWMTMLQYGLKLDNIPDPLIEYRISEGQNSTAHRQEQEKTVKKIKSEYAQPHSQTSTANNHYSISK